MNPLTQVKNTQKINAREAAAGVSEQGSWHEKYKESAYINIGLLAFDLTEGDLLAVFAQYGEVVDVNLIRDKATGKSRGFAYLAYEDQRSTVLAVDNLNGASVLGRTIRVDHVANYKKKKEEDEEEEKRKREERGVCYAFQRGECNRGDACKFSHDEQRNANTGWGKKDDGQAWGRQRDRKSPPPPPWKRGNVPKDNPPWRRNTGQSDGPPSVRTENGYSKPQTRDDDRLLKDVHFARRLEKDDHIARRHELRSRDNDQTSRRQRNSEMDGIPLRSHDNGSEFAKPSKRHDDGSEFARPSKRHDDGSELARPSKRHDEGSEFARPSKRHDDGSEFARPSKRQNDGSGFTRPSKRHDDGSEFARPSKTHDDGSEFARASKRHDDGLDEDDRPLPRRHDNGSSSRRGDNGHRSADPLDLHFRSSKVEDHYTTRKRREDHSP